MSKHFLAAALAALALCGCNAASREEAVKPAAVEAHDVEVVCVNSQVPDGWYVTAFFDRGECGEVSVSTFNSKEIRRFDDKRGGATINICSEGNVAPNGWLMIAKRPEPKCSAYKESYTPGTMITLKRPE